MEDTSPAVQRHALVICDVQTVALNALPDNSRRSLLDFLQLLVQAAQLVEYKVIFSGLQFSDDYKEVPINHKLFGAFKRLYEKTGCAARWFVKDQADTDFCVVEQENAQSINNSAATVWRSSHMPASAELSKELEGYTHVAVVGIKTGYAVQATVQALCDLGLRVSVIEECVMDDDLDRHEAVMEHLIPVYANTLTMAEWLDQAIGLDRFQEKIIKDDSSSSFHPSVRYLADCGRGGHALLYMENLLQQRKGEGWCRYPLQPWYTDEFSGKSYWSPLGKQTLDLCDEPQFSRYSMFVKGREWLDEKEKVWELASECMPATYLVGNQSWVGGQEPENYNSEDGPYFVKECDKNGGRAVQVSGSLSDALALCDPMSKYVVQTHVANPLLTNKGQKCHIKAYFLLKEKFGQWQLLMHPDAFLCVSPKQWSATDLTAETQVTIKRHIRMTKRKECLEWKGWPLAYDSCKDVVNQVVERAIAQDKLQSRIQTTCQFEIFSADVMIDTSYKAWLIECNFGCVLFDPTIGQPLTTTGLAEYQRLYDIFGDSAVVNDHDMIADTLALIFEESSTPETKWDLAGTYS